MRTRVQLRTLLLARGDYSPAWALLESRGAGRVTYSVSTEMIGMHCLGIS